MTRKNIITLVIIFFAAVFLTLLVLYFYVDKPSSSTNGSGVTSGFGKFFSFGGSSSSGNQFQTSSSTDTNATSTVLAASTTQTIYQPLREITPLPIGGASIFTRALTKDEIASSSIAFGISATSSKATTTKTVIRYVDRATGNIYEVDPTTFVQTRVSNTTIPKIYEAYFTDKGDSTIFRYLNNDTDEIDSYFGTISQESATSTENILKGSFLPVNIADLAISPLKNRIATISPDPNNSFGALISISGTGGGNRTILYTSPLKEWLIAWPNEKLLTLTSKASANVSGVMYTLNTVTKSLTKVLSDIPGLTTLTSPDAQNVLYSSNDGNGGIDLNIYNIKSGNFFPFFVKTLPEKCVWSNLNASIVYCAVPEAINTGNYPDDWYKGLISFSDTFWKVNIATGETQYIASPQNLVGKEMDAINLSLSPNEDHLIFTNKKDLSLWQLNLITPSSTPSITASSTQTQI